MVCKKPHGPIARHEDELQFDVRRYTKHRRTQDFSEGGSQVEEYFCYWQPHPRPIRFCCKAKIAKFKFHNSHHIAQSHQQPRDHLLHLRSF